MVLIPEIHAQEFDWQGHRGCRGLMPENTIEAFLEALKYPVTTLELDVVISKDRQVVVSHEPWISARICLDNGKEFPDTFPPEYNIYSMDYERIREFDCGVKPNYDFPYQKKIQAYKPLLTEVFRAVETGTGTSRKPPIRFNIEIKSSKEGEGVYHPEVKEFTDLVVAEIKKSIPFDRITIQSFDIRVLEYCHAAYPQINLALLVESGDAEENIGLMTFKPDIYSPNYRKLKKRDVEICHTMDIKVIPWTVNTSGSIRKMIRMGVDGIITDFPNLID